MTKQRHGPSRESEIGSRGDPRIVRLAATASWKKYLEENHVEDVFLRGAQMGPFLDEQIDIMRRVLREAGVT